MLPAREVHALPKEGRVHDPGGLVTAVDRRSVAENWRCAVPYGYKFENLLAVLNDRTPEEADTFARRRKHVEHGLLSVGLKIHYLRNRGQFLRLVDRLGECQ
jgi:hypothetical protein